MLKKLSATAAILLFVFSVTMLVASCKNTNDPVDNSPAPTEQQTEVPTAEPAEEPQVPEIILSSFLDYAEEYARIYPGEGDNEFHYSSYEKGDSWEGGSDRFYVADGKIYLREYRSSRRNYDSIFVYDTATGIGSRIADEPSEDNRLEMFAVIDGRVITNNSIFDIESSEHTELEALVSPERVLRISSDENGIYQLAGSGDELYRAELENGKWEKKGTIFKSASDPYHWISFTFEETGVSLTTPYRTVYLGDDAEGAHYFMYDYALDDNPPNVQGEHTQLIIMKYDAQGVFEKAVSPTIGWENLLEGGEDFMFGNDGAVYMMACLSEYVVIYRIAL